MSTAKVATAKLATGAKVTGPADVIAKLTGKKPATKPVPASEAAQDVGADTK